MTHEYDFCPQCSNGLSNAEKRLGYCQNCNGAWSTEAVPAPVPVEGKKFLGEVKKYLSEKKVDLSEKKHFEGKEAISGEPEPDLIPFVMYLTGYKEEQAVRVYENWKRNVKNQ